MIDSQPERAIVNPITDADSQITKFCNLFADLRKSFDSGIVIRTAQVASSIDEPCGYLQSFSRLTWLISTQC